jgi:hypothetical protein
VLHSIVQIDILTVFADSAATTLLLLRIEIFKTKCQIARSTLVSHSRLRMHAPFNRRRTHALHGMEQNKVMQWLASASK